MALNNLGLGMIFTAKDLASGVMGHVRGSMGEITKEAGAMGAAVKGSFKSFGTGLALAGAGLAGLALLEPAVEESAKLSKAIALVATETSEAIFPQEKMRDLSEELAVQFGKLPVEQAQAMYKAVALGANDAAKAQAFLTGVNKLAVAGDADLITTTNALGGVLNAYGESFTKADAYAGSFFVAMRQGNTTIQDLASSIGRIAPTTKSLNVSFDEVIGAVSVMTNKGIQASEAVSGLKEAFANIVHPSADARAEAARLGVKFDQTSLRAKGFKGFLDAITSSSKFNEKSFSKLFTSVEGMSAIINVSSNGMRDYANVLDAMGGKTTAVNDGLAIMQQTLSFQEDRFKANKAVVLGMIGKALEPLAIATLRVVNTILEGFAKIPKPIVAFATKAFLAASVFLTLVGGALAAKAAFVFLAAGMKAVGITIGGLLTALAPVLVIFGVFAATLYGFKIAYEQNLGGFATMVDRTVATVKMGFMGLAQLFTQGGFSGPLQQELAKSENQGIKGFAIQVFLWVNRIKKFFRGLFDGFSTGIEMARPAIQQFTGAFEKLAETLGLATQNDPKKSAAGWQSFGDTGMRVGRVLAKVFEGVVFVLTKAITVAQFFAENWDTISKGIDYTCKFVGAVFGFMGDAIGAGIDYVRSLFSGLIDAFHGVSMMIAGILQGNWSEVWKGFKLLVFGVVDGITGAVLAMVRIIASSIDRIAGMFGKDLGLADGIKGFSDDLHNAMAKDFGIADETGLRGDQGKQTTTLGGPQKVGVGADGLVPLRPLTSANYSANPYDTPALAAVQAQQAAAGAAPDTGYAAVEHLKKIADNTTKPAQVNVFLDGDKLPVRRGPDARSFTPLPIPGT